MVLKFLIQYLFFLVLIKIIVLHFQYIYLKSVIGVYLLATIQVLVMSPHMFQKRGILGYIRPLICLILWSRTHLLIVIGMVNIHYRILLILQICMKTG